MDCRICHNSSEQILDLGAQPLANSLLRHADDSEVIYPLKFFWCEACQFGQVNDIDEKLIFTEAYPYYSSVNKSYVNQCKEWAEEYLKEFKPKATLEIGSNDGYMLENFKHLPNVLGFEPSHGPAETARQKGINTVGSFFPPKDIIGSFDLIIANNVIAHTPDLHSMIKGIEACLSLTGHVVIEFPTVRNLFNQNQWDTIYHEHFSYFSIQAISRLFYQYGLYLFRAEPVESHGGSTRVYFKRRGDRSYADYFSVTQDVRKLDPVKTKRFDLKRIFIEKTFFEGPMIIYGAPAKGNTYLNYLGLGREVFDFCVDDTKAKQGKFLPGSRIPIFSPDSLYNEDSWTVLITAWNFKDEIIKKVSKQFSYIQFLTRSF